MSFKLLIITKLSTANGAGVAQTVESFDTKEEADMAHYKIKSNDNCPATAYKLYSEQ